MKFTEKTCGNCRFFIRHYIKLHSGFTGIDCGHCINDNINKISGRKKYRYKQCCEYWETMQIQTEKAEIAIKERLERLAKELEKVCKVIENDLNE